MRNTVVLTLAAVLAFTVAGATTVYARLQHNVKVADALSLAGPAPTPSSTPVSTPTTPPPPADPSAGQPINLLLIGSDQRNGQNGVIGGTKGVGGMRSDTTIVVHIAADRSRAELVSIPRDSLVAVPSCTMTNGKKSWAQRSAMFNTAFATGWDMGGDMASAAGCTIKTVQALTGLTINHFVVVDFVGFESMVNAIGGVPICLPTSYDSPNAGLHVKAGFQVLDGQTALAYARAREGTNMNGSDLQRAARQQQFIAAMIRQVLSKDVLTSVPRLLSFLDAATKSLTVDPGLSHLTDMAGMALSLRGLSTTDITFMTIPVATAPTDRNRVVWTSAATKIWANMVADKPIVASEAAATTPPPTTTATATPTGAATTGAPAAGATPSQSTAPAAPSTPAPLPKTYHPGDPFTANNTAGVCG